MSKALGQASWWSLADSEHTQTKTKAEKRPQVQQDPAFQKTPQQGHPQYTDKQQAHQ